MEIRPALQSDADNIWQVLLEPAIRGGETFALSLDMPRGEALAYWLSASHEVFVAEQDGTLLGSYFLRENQAGGGAHVANCVYVVAPSATGRGIAQVMCDHSLERARERGFLAMQFNLELSCNERRIRLWERAGFEIVGRLPKAFRHPALGFVDAVVMHRLL